MRNCPKCSRDLPFECFGVARRRPDGISCWCKECSRNSVKSYRKTFIGAEKHRSREKNRYEKNSLKIIEKSKLNYQKNKAKHKAATSAGHKRRMKCPVYRLWETFRQNIWYQNNKAKGVSKTRRRQAAQKNATPKWLTAIHNAQIQEVYDISVALSMQTGIQHHVDHIHALNGRNFNGLHVPWNLRAITAFDNCSRGNKLPVEDFNLSWEA